MRASFAVFSSKSNYLSFLEEKLAHVADNYIKISTEQTWMEGVVVKGRKGQNIIVPLSWEQLETQTAQIYGLSDCPVANWRLRRSILWSDSNWPR